MEGKRDAFSKVLRANPGFGRYYFGGGYRRRCNSQRYWRVNNVVLSALDRHREVEDHDVAWSRPEQRVEWCKPEWFYATSHSGGGAAWRRWFDLHGFRRQRLSAQGA